MTNQDQLKELILRYHQGKCTLEEVESLRAQLSDPNNQQLLEHIYEQLPDVYPLHELHNRKKELYKQILNDPRIDLGSHRVPQRITTVRLIKKYKVAVVAAVVLLCTLPFIYYRTAFHTEIAQLISSDSLQYAIVPGGDRARIVLDDGQIIDLEQIEGDTIISQNGFSIVKEKDGSIYYVYNSSDIIAHHAVYNTIVTPKGGQYHVRLPDGSSVWLNAESSLRYPVFFTGDFREVELKGEAYFEVAKNTKSDRHIPFIVHSGKQSLEVLGTIFNIESYGKSIKTTLVEGKVRLGLEDGSAEGVVLKPGEQATLSDGRKVFQVKDVDLLYATAWKNGNFSFQRASIREVMESVSRWYDVEIVYQGSFSKDFFTGTISRFEKIDKLLKTIELTGSVQFKIEGRRIIVKE